MARYSGARWRPVPWANARDDNTEATIVILHVTASNTASQYGYFLTSQKACSHFHVALDGEVEQYIDTSKLSAADYEGSDNAISIETAGLGDGQWTPAQLAALVELLAWIHKTHDIPLTLKTTSSQAPGIGWHRLGITGNFPPLPSLLAGRNQRGYAGEAWSLSGGKVCPGSRRIEQIPALVNAAKRAAGGSTDTEEPDMNATQAIELNETREIVGELKALLAEVHAGIAPAIPTSATKDPEKITLRAAVRDIRIAVTRQLDDAVAQGVAAALQGVTGVDKAALTAGVVEEVRKALESVEDTQYVLTPKEN